MNTRAGCDEVVVGSSSRTTTKKSRSKSAQERGEKQKEKQNQEDENETAEKGTEEKDVGVEKEKEEEIYKKEVEEEENEVHEKPNKSRSRLVQKTGSKSARKSSKSAREPKTGVTTCARPSVMLHGPAPAPSATRVCSGAIGPAPPAARVSVARDLRPSTNVDGRKSYNLMLPAGAAPHISCRRQESSESIDGDDIGGRPSVEDAHAEDGVKQTDTSAGSSGPRKSSRGSRPSCRPSSIQAPAQVHD